MIFVADVELPVSGLAAELELEEVHDPRVGFDDVLLENWMKFDDFDARGTVGLFECTNVVFVHCELFDVRVLE